MTSRLSYGYVGFLLVLEVLSLATTLLLHVRAILGVGEPHKEYGLMLFCAALVLGALVTPFLKNNLYWMKQIKSCPMWMWMTALAVGLYGLSILCLGAIVLGSASASRDTMAISSFPLAFDAISVCILYSVLCSGYLAESEVVRRSRLSAIGASFGAIVFLVCRLGRL
jgi:hypothetical protein